MTVRPMKYSARDFPQLPEVRSAINALFRIFGPKHLQSYQLYCQYSQSKTDTMSDIELVRYLVQNIVSHYRLPLARVIATYSSVLTSPARIELSSDNYFFIEIHSSLRSDIQALTAVIAHEVAHIILHRCRATFPTVLEEEIATDATAIYHGFGPSYLNAASVDFQFSEAGSSTRRRHFGYVSLNEFGYMACKRDAICGENSESFLELPLANNAYIAGNIFAKNEVSRRPFTDRSFLGRTLLKTRLQILGYPNVLEPLTITCPWCFQKLRIPKTFKKMLVHCSLCKSKLCCFA